MYSVRKRVHQKRHWPIIAAVLIVLVAAGIYIFRQFMAETQAIIQNTSSPANPAATDVNDKKLHFEEAVFQFDLPADWKKLKVETTPYIKYSYQSNVKNAENRYLDIYRDNLPLSMAVNKAVAVRSIGDALQHGSISDNCLTYTPAPTGNTKPLTVPGRWDGISFICDNDTTTRNVVGTSSPNSVNKVSLTGKTTGPHSFFFVYTDNNHNPDYTIFYNMLDSFLVR